jgi:regulator of protease activity HflC (stomatin/prohibitin superfamily)
MPFLIAIGVFLVLVISTAFGSFYTVDQTERAVLLRNGAIVSTEQPGLHFKLPFIESVEKIIVTNKVVRWEKLEGYSHDQQSSHYMISVNYSIKPDRVADVYAGYGNAENVVARIITPNVLKHSKTVIGTFTAQTSIQDRGRLNNEITKAVQAATEGSPLLITNVNVEDIQFSAEYNASINKRMTAEVEVQTLTQNLAKEKVSAQITVTKATAEAESKLAVATAEAKGKVIVGEAEAKAIEAKGKALGLNPNYVAMITAEAWNGVLPVTMLPGGAVPMINLGAK